MTYTDATRIAENIKDAASAAQEDLESAVNTFGESAEALLATDARNLQAFKDKLVDLTRWLGAALR